MPGLRAAELEVLFTADTAAVSKAEKDVKAAGTRIEKQKTVKTVTADTTDAIKGMDRVQDAAARLVSQATIVKVDADVEKAEAETVKLREQLDYLRAISPNVEVDADIARAEGKLSRVERSLAALQSARAEMTVDADISPAEDALAEAADAGTDAGADTGDNFGVAIIAALATIPIAGAVIGVGKAAADALLDAFQDGLAQEQSTDRLQGLTGLSEKDASRFGRAASEAYASGFGESIEQNMDAARLGVQFGIIDPEMTSRDAKRVIEGLGGIADVLGEDVQPIAAAVTTLLSTGLVKSADQAFDLLATGAREGVNRNEDLLDTLTEYPAVFARLGLSGEESLGLLNQGLENGARNSDLAADALKEFQIRATDGSKLSAEGFEAIGLSAEEMTAKIAAGGEGAKEGLDQVLDGLRAIEDPVARNAAAVALFGTQAEDLGAALFAMDLTNPVEQLNGVEGAASRMFDTLASNDASSIETAGRNIEVAMNGIKGALAAGFAEPIAEAAKYISENRGPMIGFFSDLVDGALEFGHTLIDVAADGSEAFGEFISGPIAELVEGLAGAIDVFNGFEGRPKELDDLAEGMRGFKDESVDAAENIRGLHDGLDQVSENVHGVLDGAEAMGYLNDASLRLAESVGAVGYASDGTKLSLEGVDVANLTATESGAALEEQIRNAVAAMGEEQAAAAATGESQSALTERHKASTDALVGQLVQMGLTETQARDLIASYNDIPESEATIITSNAVEEKGKADSFALRITTLPDGSVTITAATAAAEARIQAVRDLVNSIPTSKTVTVNYSQNGAAFSDSRASAIGEANGGIVEFMAAGGIRGGGLTPMQPIAQMVPPSTWRVVGDRSDVPEAYIPLDGSARSAAILAEVMQRMGMQGMAAGGITPGQVGGKSVVYAPQVILSGTYYAYDPQDLARQARDGMARAMTLAGVPRRAGSA